MIIRVDIDETICFYDNSINLGQNRDYSQAKPSINNVSKINKFYDDGHTIIYWTARGSRSKIDWYDLTYNQLLSWNAKFHKLETNKPYYDLFIEDRSIRIEEIL